MGIVLRPFLFGSYGIPIDQKDGYRALLPQNLTPDQIALPAEQYAS